MSDLGNKLFIETLDRMDLVCAGQGYRPMFDVVQSLRETLDALTLATQRAEAAEAEGDAALKSLDEEWVTHQQMIAITAERDALREVAEAATDMLKYGAHDGPCDNEDDEDEACTLHVKASRSRTVTLRAALDAALAVQPTTEGM